MLVFFGATLFVTAFFVDVVDDLFDVFLAIVLFGLVAAFLVAVLVAVIVEGVACTQQKEERENKNTSQAGTQREVQGSGET